MFRKIGDGLRKFMAGRYGSDRLNQCLLGAAFVLILISAIGGRRVQWMSVLSFWPISRSSGQSSACIRATSKRAGVKTRRSCVFQPSDG